MALRNPANRHRAVALTPDEFRYGFGNTLSEEESRKAYDRYAVPGPGRVLFQAALANVDPRAATKVDTKNGARAPLLLVGAGHDHTVPASVTRSAYKLEQKSSAPTELKEYPQRSHWTCMQDGWESVADHALDWAREHAGRRAAA